MFADKPDIFSLLYCVLPPDILIGAAAGTLIARLRGGAAAAGPSEKDAPGLALASALALTPLLAAFALSVSGTSIWVDRYFICYQLGIALAAGLLLGRLNAAALRPAAAAITIFALASHAHIYHIKEDWAGAMDFARQAAERRHAGLLLTSPFIESRLPGWLGDPSKKDYLSAPRRSICCRFRAGPTTRPP